jgi:predicted dehydrogenase
MNTSSGAVRHFSQLGSRGFHRQIAAFLESVMTGGPPPVSAQEGLLALQISLAAVESLRTRSVVRFSDIAAQADS